MNHSMVQRLVLKDWYFGRWPIAFYLVASAIAVTLLALGGETRFYLGAVLLVTALLGLGIHLTMLTVVEERQKQTLPFVMSLPVSVPEYTTAKILANLLLFLIPWSVCMIGTVAVVLFREGFANGALPYFVVMLVLILTNFCALLATALITESLGWTVAAIVAGNLLFQFLAYFLSHIPQVAEQIEGTAIVWSPPILIALTAELLAIPFLLWLTYSRQARKTDFL